MTAKSNLTTVRSFLQKLRADRGGNTLAMMAAAMVPLAGMIGGGLDMSRVYMARAKLQNACDAASLAGRQSMSGASFTSADSVTANKYFNFNFPAGTMAAENVTFTVRPHPTDSAALEAFATADIPTSLMRIFGQEYVDIAVSCNAKRELGNNDIMLVLDVTGSMLCAPGIKGTCTESADSKIRKLRNGSLGLYRALQQDNSGQTRYGIMPYSGTVNVARRLTNDQVVQNMDYPDCNGYAVGYTYNGGKPYDCNAAVMRNVHINDTIWKDQGNGTNQRIAAWRTSGEGCIEERASMSAPTYPPVMNTTVTSDDINLLSRGWFDLDRKWGRYDYEQWSTYIKAGTKTRSAPSKITDPPYWQVGCPSEALRLRTFGGENGYKNAIDAATAKVTGGTYHDIGMIWGMRFISPDGLFAGSNPSTFNGYPVNKHIIFMTDGLTDTQTNPRYYSAYGVNAVENRLQGPGTTDDRHVARFHSACALARSMNITVWVIALDVTDTTDVEPCATSADHFYTSDGTDLEDVFTQIGKGIGDLRLTT
ncbi:pilus assembly protein [Parasphingorhabdus halotolerans]|uniref:Putative Flp pilus-assembly TadG-like N-terminal domain-containing protein n=1 Tax=Parasphingorhabdus halotolerans TaxID=2725558 RepID=A0A6H2DGW0_9SPHN|nr:TadE/TadG family type IV pilus assembly protein [Parasphingorhabdus halotolerans]QJB67909.1 hypothetical protein HF685_00110 [Parasphingorhabdus halotolerans]